jgi:thiamine phosphate synthase YjbQ (UPF0047 family)
MQGFIKDHRKELESDIWLMPPLYHRVWQYLKYKVNHEEAYIPMRDGTKFYIQKGQHMTSVRNIAKDIGWYEGVKWKEPNPKTINSILEWLVKQRMIHIDKGKGNRQYTLVTLIKWGEYQNKLNEGNSKVTVDGQASKQSVDINKNDKNDKEDIYTVFEHWKSKGIIVHKKLNDKMKSHINARLGDYELSELLKAIDNYNEVLTNDLYYWTHRWTLQDFMTPNNVIRFMDSSKPFETFLANKTNGVKPKQKINWEELDTSE